MNIIITAITGLAAGIHAATWGTYKDSIYEGFSLTKYIRSVVLAIILAFICQQWLSLNVQRISQILLLFGVVYVFERMLIELWKLFVREEDQAKYTIPMRFAMRGLPVHNNGARWIAGLVYVLAIGVGVVWLTTLHRNTLMLPHLVNAILLGAFGGSFTAVGGAWKDAPSEGFSMLKFLRSPLLSVAFAVLLSPFTDKYEIIVLAALGFERATTETYKTFYLQGRPAGKFAGKAIQFPELLSWRKRFVPLYFTICLGILAGFVVAFIPG